jgi:hypothetical protein
MFNSVQYFVPLRSAMSNLNDSGLAVTVASGTDEFRNKQSSEFNN